MFRQVVAAGYGGPEQLAVREHDPGQPGEGQALVEVRAVGVNAWDVKSYSGDVGDDPGKLPILLGGECAGIVLDGDLDEGAEVIVHPVSGAYADRVVAKVTSCVPKPDGMSWEEAAGLMLTGTAAAHLVAATGVGDGDTVLLNGAAGGVGLYAAQLARHRGARVLGTALPGDHAVLREMGVEPFDFREDVEAWVRQQAPGGVDAVLDAVGAPPVLDLSLAVVNDRARVATLIPSPAAAERGITQLGFGEGADPGTELRAAARFDLVEGVREGWLRVVVAGTFPLDRAADAHRAMVSDHGAGKLVLVP
ncbi:MAG TPA: NADP-dependent oxidoreductase [Nocardioides sp.]|uniref:quinone oxidoreductase family protein n=1 Tax=Nocardioides sp. TaxID=35761 RepID=UPI002E36A188|nr:NADP-dependent oxidoreductase [Nocardioides sp.]HEX5090755.1 NADP-dependent oxidoreductase [Nocardioides sp.]